MKRSPRVAQPPYPLEPWVSESARSELKPPKGDGTEFRPWLELAEGIGDHQLRLAYVEEGLRLCWRDVWLDEAYGLSHKDGAGPDRYFNIGLQLAACTLLWLNRPMEAFFSSSFLCKRSLGLGIYPLAASSAQAGSYAAMTGTLELLEYNGHSATALWGKAILLSVLDAGSPEAESAYAEAMAENRFVPSVLSDRSVDFQESRQTSFAHGFEDEAYQMVQFYQPVWRSLPSIGAVGSRHRAGGRR